MQVVTNLGRPEPVDPDDGHRGKVEFAPQDVARIDDDVRRVYRAVYRRSSRCTASKISCGSFTVVEGPTSASGTPCAGHGMPVGQRSARQPRNRLIVADRGKLQHF